MEVYRRSSWLLLLLVELGLFFIALQGVHGEVDIQEGPSESECRPYIEKALKQLESGDTLLPSQDDGDSKEDIPTIEITTDDSDQPTGYGENEDDGSKKDSDESTEVVKQESSNDESSEKDDESKEDDDVKEIENDDDSGEQNTSADDGIPTVTIDNVSESETETPDETLTKSEESQENDLTEKSVPEVVVEYYEEQIVIIDEIIAAPEKTEQESKQSDSGSEATNDEIKSKEEDDIVVKEEIINLEATTETASAEESKETENANTLESTSTEDQKPGSSESDENIFASPIDETQSKEEDDSKEVKHEDKDKEEKVVTTDKENKKRFKREAEEEDTSKEESVSDKQKIEIKQTTKSKETQASSETESKEDEDATPVEELISASEEVLEELRPRDHIDLLLKLDEDSSSNAKLIERTSEIILRDLKKLYENAIKPLEILYKYKDLSNRHFGDSEIFAKPLILFMGPWSGGKSSIINYLLGIENTEYALHTGAEPSPAYFNILMYGQEPEILDGTQLAADYTFSGLQKFGQGLEERLRGYKLPNKLLEKVNIVEIPGILEVRKQVSRVFPFNDACQWFIDRADIIFLVYDPSKLDVGPETEAILDQLKGREHQTRIVLNKADQVKPEELMRVQGALIWNISPLMSSAQPPIMYTTSLWSKPYESWAPVRLLQAQERAFLRDIRSAVDKRIDNKIASARRFAVRVRNHAKMVDCYLTTYYNHKSVFGNRKQISDEIINHPQDFHIYEGLSTLTNISRYDLPDPDVYRDFFRLNALYDFQQLSATCTYFRGCPINRLDIAIAYDLPELVGKHKKMIETAVNEATKTSTPKS